MPHFNDRTIAIVRRNGRAMLTQTCTLLQRSGAKGQMGEPLNVFDVAASGVLCRVIRAKTPSSSTTQPVGGANAMVDMYRLECPYDTILAVEMRVEVDDGSVYDIVTVEDKLTDSVFAAAAVIRVRS